MKIILKNNKLIVKDQIISADDQVEFVPSKPMNMAYRIAFNDDDFTHIESYSTPVPAEHLKKSEITISIEECNKSNQKCQIHKTEPIPVSVFYTIGKSIEERYPKALHELNRQIKKLKQRIEALESEGDIL